VSEDALKIGHVEIQELKNSEEESAESEEEEVIISWIPSFWKVKTICFSCIQFE
jgi:hypothetical protein